MPIRHTLLRQYLGPGVLSIVQHKRNKFNGWLFFGITGAVRLGHGVASAGAACIEQGKEVAFENKTKDQEDQESADANMPAAKSKSATTAFIPTILNIAADATWSPTHRKSPGLV